MYNSILPQEGQNAAFIFFWSLFFLIVTKLKSKGLTQEQFAVKLNISDRHLGKIERGEGTASIDLLVEVAISLNTTLDFLILGVLDTPRERELNAQIKKQHQKIQIFKNKLSNLIDELDTSASV